MAAGPGAEERAERRIVPVAGHDLVLEPGGWPEAEPHRAEIEAHYVVRSAANPALWNGALLLLRRHAWAGGVFTGAFRQTDFATFLWWREVTGWRDLGMVNAFALAAIEGSDGAFVLGVMGPHTAVPGQTYFPGGTPDLSDVVDAGRVDLDGQAMRELAEETGLKARDVARDAGFVAVYDGPRIAFMRRLVFPENGEALAARIRAFLAAERQPELQDVLVVRSERDITPRVQPFALAYMRAQWAAGGR